MYSATIFIAFLTFLFLHSCAIGAQPLLAFAARSAVVLVESPGIFRNLIKVRLMGQARKQPQGDWLRKLEHCRTHCVPTLEKHHCQKSAFLVRDLIALSARAHAQNAWHDGSLPFHFEEDHSCFDIALEMERGKLQDSPVSIKNEIDESVRMLEEDVIEPFYRKLEQET